MRPDTPSAAGIVLTCRLHPGSSSEISLNTFINLIHYNPSLILSLQLIVTLIVSLFSDIPYPPNSPVSPYDPSCTLLLQGPESAPPFRDEQSLRSRWYPSLSPTEVYDQLRPCLLVYFSLASRPALFPPLTYTGSDHPEDGRGFDPSYCRPTVLTLTRLNLNLISILALLNTNVRFFSLSE